MTPVRPCAAPFAGGSTRGADARCESLSPCPRCHGTRVQTHRAAPPYDEPCEVCYATGLDLHHPGEGWTRDSRAMLRVVRALRNPPARPEWWHEAVPDHPLTTPENLWAATAFARLPKNTRADVEVLVFAVMNKEQLEHLGQHQRRAMAVQPRHAELGPHEHAVCAIMDAMRTVLASSEAEEFPDLVEELAAARELIAACYLAELPRIEEMLLKLKFLP